jgi:hypothetical protein
VYCKHFVCLVEDKHFDVVCVESTTVLDHVQDTTGCAHDDVNTFLKDSNILVNNSLTGNTSMTLTSAVEGKKPYLHVQEISKGDDNLLNLLRKLSCGSKDQCLTLPDGVVNLLEHTDGKCSSCSGTGRRLDNDIMVLEDRHDGSLLNG